MRVLNCRVKVLLAEKSLRERRKITQEQAAKEAGIDRVTFDRLARNDFKGVQNKTLLALANYFECQIGDLLVAEDFEEENHPEHKAPALELQPV
jgi:putative transcriptional regulator